MSAGSGTFYARRVFPWLNDLFCSDAQVASLRAETLRHARGRVVEIGFGTGLNLPHYPAAVDSIVAVEPNPGMVRRAAARLAASPIPVDLLRASAQSLPLPDAGFDTAVSVLTLCTVPDPHGALAELRRVLRDDGRLLLMEHGLAADPRVAWWQRRLNPAERVLACGCNLNRPTAAIVRASGFRFETVREFFLPGVPRTHGWFTIGSAVKAR